MSDKLHLGWLQTRDQENYAPKTVIEGVYQASSGKLYDQVIKEYIDNKVKDVNPAVATLQTTVATHTTEISNLKSADNALNSSIDAIEKSIENIQDDGSDALYITDNSGYKIAQIDKYGIHSVEVHNKDTSLGAVADRMAAAETQLSNIADGDLSANDDTFYIVDKDDYIIAKIDEDGITSTDFIIKNGEEFSSLLDLINNNQSGIITLRNELQKALDALTGRVSGLETSVSEIRNVIDTSDSDGTFYIIDQYDNIIAKIDSNGVHSVDFTVEDEGSNNIVSLVDLKTAYDNLRDNKDDSIDTRLGSLETKLNSTINAHVTIIDGRIGAVETTIPTLEEAVSKLDNIDISAEEGKIVITDDTEESNKIVEIDSDGVKSVDFTTNKVSLNNLYSQLYDNTNEENKVNTADIPTINSRIETNTTSLSILNGSGEGSINSRIKALRDELVPDDAGSITNFGIVKAQLGDLDNRKLNESVFNTYQADQVSINDAQTTSIGNHEIRLTTLEADETVENSIRHLIKQLKEAVINGALTYKDFKAIEDKLNQQDKILNLDETSNAFYIIDKDENIIFKVDNQGVSTTGLFASNLTFNNNYNMRLNGVFIDSDKLKDIEVELDIED